MTPANDIKITTQDGVLLARVECARMEDQNAQDLVVEVGAAAEQAPSLPVVLDLSQVAVMPSISIGVLVTLWKKFHGTGQQFILVGMQSQVRQTLTLCRLDKLFELCDSIEEAKSRLRQNMGDNS